MALLMSIVSAEYVSFLLVGLVIVAVSRRACYSEVCFSLNINFSFGIMFLSSYSFLIFWHIFSVRLDRQGSKLMAL